MRPVSRYSWAFSLMALPMPGDFLQVHLVPYRLLQGKGKVADGSGGPLVSANLEHGIALHLQKGGHVLENLGYVFVGYGHGVFTAPAGLGTVYHRDGELLLKAPAAQDDCNVPYQPLMVSLSNHFLLRCVLRQAQDERHSADLPDFAIVLPGSQGKHTVGIPPTAETQSTHRRAEYL